MSPADDWWRSLAALTPEAPPAAVLALVDRVGELGEVPWHGQLAAVTMVLGRWLGPPAGVGVYIAQRPGAPLWLAHNTGIPGGPLVDWGSAAVGLAARERALHLADEAAGVLGHPGGAVGVVQTLAIPVVRSGVLTAVLEARSSEPGRIGLAEAQLAMEVADRLAGRWPERMAAASKNPAMEGET
ncbi:MAG: hypothetical protein M0Z53_10015 [Thermaerobacter sp.]|nr:hypothetical protein [Thermaerobacter sp.]